MSAVVRYREASSADLPAMALSRLAEAGTGPTDARLAAYLLGKHHPQRALALRVAFVALRGDEVVGYIGGHLTRRYGCGGELHTLYVAPEHRRRGVGGALFQLLATWFRDHDARRVCVHVGLGNAGGRGFFLRHGADVLNRYWLVWDDVGAE